MLAACLRPPGGPLPMAASLRCPPCSTRLVDHPRLYVCGHIHVAKGEAQGTGRCATTRFINGASVLGDHSAAKGAAAYTINGGPILVHL